MKLFVCPMLSILAATVIVACDVGDRPFRMVQFCLAGVHEVDELKATVRSLAAEHDLEYGDRSADTEAEAQAILEAQPDGTFERPRINVAARAADGMGFSVTNFLEDASQVVIGFSAGEDDLAARRLSDDVVQRLERHWRVHEVPSVETQGAFPLADCTASPLARP